MKSFACCYGYLSLSIWLGTVRDCSMDGAYRLSLKATLGNESRAACQSRLAASLMLLSNTCWSGKYESPIVWFSSYSVIKGWHLVEWLARTLMLQSQFSGSRIVELGKLRSSCGKKCCVRHCNVAHFFCFIFMAQCHSFLSENNKTLKILLLKCFG